MVYRWSRCGKMDDRSIVIGPCSGKDDKVVYIHITTIASPNEGTCLEPMQLVTNTNSLSAGYKI